MAEYAKRWSAGESLSAAKLNKTVDLVNRLVRSVPTGATPQPVARNNVILRLEIKSIDDGARAMVGVFPGATPSVDQVAYTITLQPIFTETSRGGVTYAYTGLNTRTADATENQEITPPFVVGETVYCIYDPVTAAMLFMGDGRMWAQVT